ncbi:MAG: hypothetical protein WBA74_26350, partial [Cyclobacteriaceae bacterium]
LQQYDKFLIQHGYHIGKSDEHVYRIEKKQPLSRFLILSVFVLGLVICVFSVIISEYRLTLLGFLMVLFPLINRGWSYPLAIVFDRMENFLTLERGVLFKSYKLYQMDNIDEIAVHRVSKATEVNPFEEGNKEHVYVFSFMEKDKSHQLMRFVSRKNIDKSAKTFSSYLNGLTK